MSESNPVMQKMNHLSLRWDIAKSNRNFRLAKLLYKDDEHEMLDTFYTFTLGIDADFEDISFLFETSIKDIDKFSEELVKELEDQVIEWNSIEKPEGYDNNPIEFVIDNTYKNDKNKAAHFFHNFQKLIETFKLEKGIYGVAIFLDTYSNPPLFEKWMHHTLDFLKKETPVRIIIGDDKENPNYNSLDIKYENQVKTLVCNFEVNKVIQQISTLSDPKEPGYAYRIEFMKMFDAIETRKADLAKKHGENCVEIATNLLEKDPYWMGQIVTVYFALANDQIGYKNFKKALEFATKAVDSAELSLGYMEPEMGKRLIGQTLLNRAGIYVILKKWDKALADSQQAKVSYLDVKDQIMGLEAYRMCMYVGIQKSNDDIIGANMNEGFEMAEQMNPDVVKTSSFVFIAHELLNRSNTIPTDRKKALFEKVYGENWRFYIENIYKPEKLEAIET